MENVEINELTQRQIDWVMYWYKFWNDEQKGSLMNSLIASAIPNDVNILLNAVGAMSMEGRRTLPAFIGQIKVFNKWFDEWSPLERQFFMEKLQSKDPDFVTKFHERVNARRLDLSNEGSINMEYSFSMEEDESTRVQ